MCSIHGWGELWERSITTPRGAPGKPPSGAERTGREENKDTSRGISLTLAAGPRTEEVRLSAKPDRKGRSKKC